MQDLKQLTTEVEKIVREIGDWVLTQQDNAKREVEKEKGDYATDIDLESDRKLVSALKELDSSIDFETEEGTDGSKFEVQSSKFSWVIDPIDGTKNYFRRLPLWSVNVALYDKEAKEVLIGVVYFPKLGDMFVAYKGGGSFRNGEKCVPSDTSDPKEAIVYVEMPLSEASTADKNHFSHLINDTYRMRGWGVAAALCYLADGGFDAHIDLSGTTKTFDILAPLLVATESGCKIKGTPPNYVRATNPTLDVDEL